MLTAQLYRCMGIGIFVVAFLLAALIATAQQSSSPKAGPAAVDSSATEAISAEAAAKKKIISSPEWKQAHDDFQRWLSTQAIYTPADIERIKATLIARIQDMPAGELQGFLDDWQARLKVLGSSDSQDAQQWLGQYLSVLVDGLRRQTLKDLGLNDLPNMSASQLEDAFDRVRARRMFSLQQRAAFDLNRQQMVQRTLANNAAAREARQQTSAASFATNRSPYRPPRFDPPPNPRRQFFVDSNGRIIFALPN